MDPDTGHLVSPEGLRELQEMMVDTYQQVPDELAEAANLELAGRKECYVGKQSTGSVNTWAAKQRAKRRAMKKVRKLCCR